MRGSRFVASALLTLGLTAVVGTSRVHALDCTALAGRTYNCTEKSDYYQFQIDDSLTFTANGNGKLILHSNTYNVDFHCTCLAKGTYAKPHLDASTGFLCGGVTSDPSSIGDAITGKVQAGGKKIKGEYFRRGTIGTAVAGEVSGLGDGGIPVPDDARVVECTEAGQ